MLDDSCAESYHEEAQPLGKHLAEIGSNGWKLAGKFVV
jgi:hypothetical protein